MTGKLLQKLGPAKFPSHLSLEVLVESEECFRSNPENLLQFDGVDCVSMSEEMKEFVVLYERQIKPLDILPNLRFTRSECMEGGLDVDWHTDTHILAPNIFIFLDVYGPGKEIGLFSAREEEDGYSETVELGIGDAVLFNPQVEHKWETIGPWFGLGIPVDLDPTLREEGGFPPFTFWSN